MKKDFRYTTKAGNELQMTLYQADKVGQWPGVIYLHGFKGFKDWGFVPHIGEYMASRGYCLLTFNFSHNGIGEQPTEFTELDKFEQNSFSLELSEALEVIHMYAHTEFFGAYTREKVHLLGHSRGGGIALLAGSNNANVASVATWGSISRFDRYDKKTRQQWRKQGYQEVVNSRTGQVFKLGLNLLNDIEKKAKKELSILNAARNLGRPWLILHGESDQAVPYFEAEELNIYGNPLNTRLQLIAAAGHTFEAKHPFEGSNPQLDYVLKETVDFFENAPA